MYSVKEIFYTLQGEGARSGRPAVFCRFAGCNLWNGLERDRASAVCNFCDTDFVGLNGQGGGRFSNAADLCQAIARYRPGSERSYVVCTGGEPMLQLDTALVEALHAAGFEVAVETNGTLAVAPGVDWICVSPKAAAPLQQRHGDELKLVYPQPQAPPERFTRLNFAHFFLQPMDGPRIRENTQAALAYCMAHPQWSLSLQTHKLLGIP